MNKWFYAKDGQAIGPLSTPEMHELIAQGGCTRTTLVWTRGMRDWLPACMAAWMWEQRAESGSVTTGDDAQQDGARSAAPESQADEAAPPSTPMAPRSSMPTASRSSHTDASRTPPDQRSAEGPDAGVVGMVRKLFGLG